MQAHKQRTIKTCFDVLILIAGLVVLALFLTVTQTKLAVERQEDNFKTKLDIAAQRLTQNAAEATENLASYDAFSQAKLDSVARFLGSHPGYAKTDALTKEWGLTEFFTIDRSNQLTYPAAGSPDLTAEPYATLLAAKTPVTEGETRYYIAELPGGGFAIGARDATAELAALDTLVSPARALSTIKVGENGFVVATDARTHKIAYAPTEALIGQDAAAVGFTASHLTNGWEGYMTVEGKTYYTRTRGTDDYILTAAVPEAELTAANWATVNLVLIVFAAAMALLVAYALILRRDEAMNPMSTPEYIQLGKHLYFNKTMGQKIRNVAVICLIAIFALSYYMQTLGALSRQSAISANKLTAVTEILDDNQSRITSLTDEYAAEYTARAQHIAYTLAEDPTAVNDETLAEIASCAQVAAIYVFDDRGRVVATNTTYKDFVLSGDENDQSYPFWSVAKGYTDVYVQQAQPDDTMEANLMQYVGVRRMDGDGMVQLGMLPRRLKSRLAATEQDYVLRSIAVENGGYLFAVNKLDGTFLTYPTAKYAGRPASEYGLTETALRDDFSGYQTIDGTKCFVTSAEYGDTLIYTAVPLTQLFSGRLKTTLIVTAGSFAAILVICAFLLLSRKMTESAAENAAPGAPKQPRRFFRIVSPNGKTRIVQSASSRWSGAAKWKELTPEQKLSRILSGMVSIAALAMVLWMASGLPQKNSIFSYILSTRWEKTPNIFSLTYILMIAIETLVVTGILRRILLYATGRFGARSETVGRLLDSFIKYVAVIGIVFYGLNFIGIDSTTLMTSAGILTLIVGLGAQKLIGDIIAGIFIVFEGEFRVGDIVTVGDWCGTVLEIGIRTTKIQSGGSDIKIIANSAISGVVNMTKQYSYASADIGIEYGESLERVESILKSELPLVKGRVPAIVSGPFYKGVASLGDSSVVIRIVAECQEKDRAQLNRDLNRELKLICDRNNVSIPFPQIVVNKPVEHEMATHEEKREAAEFVEEQKELSKGIHVPEEL